MLNNVKKNNKNFILQGGILAITGLIVRFIGLLYRSPLSAIIGPVGMGYYGSAYSIYSLFFILSSYAFPAAISKLISAKLVHDRFKDVKKIIIVSFLLALIVGLFVSSIVYFGADTFSHLLQKEKMSFALRALAPTLLIMCFVSVFRGIFQGMGNMVPTSISQILEQIFNAIFSIILAKVLFDKGLIANLIYETTDYEYAFGAQGSTIGTGIGAFVALIFLALLFFTLLNNYKSLLKNNNGYNVNSYNQVFVSITKIIFPILISATIFNISSIVDDFVFSNSYYLLNKKEEIKTLWGLYTQYHILFNIPVAMANALSSSILPTLSASVAMKNARDVVLKIKYSFKYTMIIVFPSFVGLFVLSEPICKMLFNSQYVDTLISILRVGSISVVFFSFSTVSITILQGIGKYYKPIINSIIALVIHIALMLFFLLFLKLGIVSVIFSNIIFSLIVLILNLNDIFKVVRYKKSILKNYIIPIVASLIMGIVVFLIYNLLNQTFLSGNLIIQLIIKVLISGGIGALTYIIILFTLRVINKRDVEFLPFLKKVIK